MSFTAVQAQAHTHTRTENGFPYLCTNSVVLTEDIYLRLHVCMLQILNAVKLLFWYFKNSKLFNSLQMMGLNKPCNNVYLCIILLILWTFYELQVLGLSNTF